MNNSENKSLDNFLISFMLNDLWMCMKIWSKIRQDNIRDKTVIQEADVSKFGQRLDRITYAIKQLYRRLMYLMRPKSN